jgi:LmbE family N-acetylglucosaminyl deacetylase
MPADDSGDGAIAAPSPDFSLLGVGRILAVCAHPDDESFGLGGILGALADAGVETDLLCFTRGEASTLGCGERDLSILRTDELTCAATVLGIRTVTVLDYTDGALSSVSVHELARRVVTAAAESDAILVFDLGGVTGHPDHCRATAGALLAADELNLPVVAWALSQAVAGELNCRFGTSFVGRTHSEVDMAVEVERTRQLAAIACHHSQDNPVMRARLELQGSHEWLRLLRGDRARC